MKKMFSLMAVAAVLATQSETEASFAYVPLEARIASAQHVVLGKIDRLDGFVQLHNRKYQVGVIEVRKVFKGAKGLDRVKLAWPAREKFAVSTDISYRVGQEGLWILHRDRMAKDLYRASYPSDYQPLAKLKDFERRLQNLAAIQWSPSVNGLQIGLIAEVRDARNLKIRVQGKSVKAVAYATVYPLVRNISDKIRHFAYHYPDDPLRVELRGPDGAKIAVKSGRFNPNSPPPIKSTFRAISPGTTMMLGYGLALPHFLDKGVYSVGVQFSTQRDGRRVGIANAWKGELSSKLVRMVAPPEK